MPNSIKKLHARWCEVKQSSFLFLISLVIALVTFGQEASTDSIRTAVSHISINGKTDKCGTILAHDWFDISVAVSNDNPFKKSVVAVFKIVDSEGKTAFSNSKEIILAALENRTLSAKTRINSDGMYTVLFLIKDHLNSSHTISNVEKMDLQVLSDADILEPRYLYDDFSNGTYTLGNYQLSPNGKWFHWYSGSKVDPGEQGVRPADDGTGNVFFLESPSPVRQTKMKKTFSALTLSTESYQNFQLALEVKTVSQTRTSSTPNPWEVGWVFWHAVGNGTDPIDRTHFYYFLVRTNGVEVGKYDGGTNPESQKIIESNNYPNKTSIKTELGKWQHWNIIVIDDRIIVKVDNVTAFDIVDTASFDTGRFALYNEDARTEFKNIYVRPLC